jgi:peptidyl-prolyl cis-trans isomerase SurA
MNRKQAHRANLTDDYALITRAAENEKKQKVINDWIQSKIGNAFIRIDSDYQKCDFKNDWLMQ